MAMEHFRMYLSFYEKKYYSRYIKNLEEIGDLFCNLSDDAQLRQWMIYQEDLSPRPFEKKRNSLYQDRRNTPPYALALQHYFYKDYLYPEDRYQEARRVTEMEQRLADLCHAGRTTVASWKSGVRVPDKYKWWTLALLEFELNFWEIQPFLDMIGCNVDMTCTDDIILFYALCAQKKQQEIFLLLKAYGCEETKSLFAPARK